ncbi:hypothetical protein OF83DRAFT_763941 [Amylostereum chailletii]|nr:hypothetical protein OF83DRAFT_763941 [Amylostereum chailletii]
MRSHSKHWNATLQTPRRTAPRYTTLNVQRGRLSEQNRGTQQSTARPMRRCATTRQPCSTATTLSSSLRPGHRQANTCLSHVETSPTSSGLLYPQPSTTLLHHLHYELMSLCSRQHPFIRSLLIPFQYTTFIQTTSLLGALPVFPGPVSIPDVVTSC